MKMIKNEMKTVKNITISQSLNITLVQSNQITKIYCLSEPVKKYSKIKY